MSEPISTKSRHGCLTAYLVVMIVAHAACTLVYLFAVSMPRGVAAGKPAWIMWCLILIGIFNVACAVALFRFKRWGFWGYVGSSVTTAVLNIVAGISLGLVLLGLAGIPILFGVLQIGKTNKGWPQLD
jgi:hypothetical protein